MPTTYTHYKFGKEVLRILPGHLRGAVECHRELFDIGLHGPDILFYYKPLKKNPVTRQGYVLHELPASEFFENGVRAIKEADRPAAARAYMYGFLCHFALDSECHPYIEKMIADSGITHSEIEMELDRMFLVRDGFNPVSRLSTGHVRPSMRNAKVISPFFDGLTDEVARKCLSSMIFYHKLFLAPGERKRKLLFAGMKAVGRYDSMHGMIMSRQPNERCREYCQKLEELFDGAVPLAAELILQYQRRIFEGAPLPDRFRRTFGAGDDWRNLKI